MRTRNGLLAIAMALVAAAGLSARAEAAPIVSIQPASQTVLVGAPFGIDIVVSDLDPGGGLTGTVGGFSLTLSFNEAIVTGAAYAIGAPLGSGSDLSFGFNGIGGTPLDLFFVSLTDSATLDAAQGTSFTLATVTFMAAASGLSPLTLSNVVLSNADGSAEIAATSANGSVCVGGPCQVPEPTSLALCALGLAFLARRRANG